MSKAGWMIDEHILQTAADWWLRLREPEIAEETMQEWLEWAHADVRHLEAFERISALGEQMGTLDEVTRRSFAKAFALPAAPARRWLPIAAAASMVALVLGGYLVWSVLAPGVVSQSYTSAVAQNRDILLPDGTQVALGGASRFAMRFTRDRRQVELSEGEAFFQVAHDAQKPFVVTAGALTIRDVGTAFDVRRTGRSVTIAVTEGRVQVAAGDSAQGTVEAVAGQQISYDPDMQAMRVGNLQPGQATAWRDDRLEFDNEPLGRVVANLNRYAARPVRIADAGLENLAFTGTIKTDAIDHWLDALPQVLPVRVSASPGEVVLSRAAQESRQ
ncbi:FecR family protein [Dyella subtropica]|uniref:FecR family protein n=1 Tax=Dyella subtropica TaxID=2992127 RepID=UPI0022535178|nr:FecR domain-containing protein [Dyella subtropica]